MFSQRDFEKAMKENYSCESFSRFLQTVENPLPDLRIYDFMVLGPFVLETEGAFETEYFFERDKTLNCDYLESDGGELLQIPYLGKKVKNDYYGPEFLEWKKGFKKWDALRFDDEEDSCNEALFVTEQRNCVFYVSTYIKCAEDTDAVICYENSGSNLYINGSLVHSQPYGRIKGMKSVGNVVPVHFNKGKNLLMFKIRTGYIADTIDLSMSNCSIYPLSMKIDNLGITQPTPTLVYFGDKEKPRQMFQSFAAAFGDCEKIEIAYSSKHFEDKIETEFLKSGTCKWLRIQAPALENEEVFNIDFNVSVNEKKGSGSFLVSTKPFCGFDGKEYAFSDFHFDTTYHQEQRTYALGAMHITKSIIDKLIEDPNFKAVLSEVDYLHPYYSIYPKHREVLKKCFKDARVESDCFYNQPNDLTSSPEGFVRNLIYGQLYHRDVMGRIVPVYAPGDVFGHPNQMSQICAKGGCIAARWGKAIMGVDNIMRHVSPDGTSLLHDKGINKFDAMRLGLKHCENSSQALSTVPAFPLDENTKWMKDTISKTEYGILSEMMKEIIDTVEKNEKEDGFSKISYTSRDLTQHHSGVLLTRTDFKQANRLAENLLVTAEKFSAIACYYGAEYPEKALDKAWRQILCAQHHDSITGTNNEISFVDLMIEYREAVELAAEIVNKAICFLASGIEAKENEKHYYLFNSHLWKRTDVCEITLPLECENKSFVMVDVDEKEIPLQLIGKTIDGSAMKGVFTATIPALGYSTFILKEVNRSDFSYDSDYIENEFYKIKVDANLGGGIVSLYDKKAKKEIINLDKDGPGNRIVVMKEIPNRMEEQHEFYTTGHKMFSSEFIADVKCEKNEAFQRFVVTVKMDTVAKIRQVITLYKGVQRVDIKTTIEDYQSRDDLFTVTFPVDVKGAKPIYDDRFAPHICSKSIRKLSFQTHQFMGFSHSRIAPANQWFEFGRTVVASFSNGENVFGDINIGMTAIIRKNEPSYINLSEKLLHTLTKKAIPVTQYPDEKQSGGLLAHHFNEDLDNTDTRIVLCVENEETDYVKKLVKSLSERERQVFDEIFHKNSKAILCLKDNDNVYKKNIDVIIIKAKTTQILSKIIDDIEMQLSKNYVLKFNNAFANYKMNFTEDYGVAILNKGTIACSVEGENLMNMMLFHTADFYGNSGKTTGKKQLIPEQKTHTFSYALYPHQKSYREANTYRSAFEFNDQLLSISGITSDIGAKRFLPKEKSFAEVSDNFTVTAFKLGGYPMAQMKSDFGTFEERGLVIRGFETNGVSKKIKVKFDFEIKDVKNTDLLEENQKAIKHSETAFSDNINAYSIETYLIKAPQSIEKITCDSKLGSEKEIVEPTYVRSWEHDLGSMNMGYLSVAGVIGKDAQKVDDLTYRFNVSMANNYSDRPINGIINFNATEGFEIDMKEMPYNIEPQGMMVQKITVKKPDAAAKGIIRMNYTNDGQLFEDLFEFGYFNPSVTLEKVDDNLVATINNETSENLYGEIAIASPFETWSASGLNSESWGNIYPRTQKYEVRAGENTKVSFKINEMKEDIFHSYWAVVKLMVNGRIHFAYIHIKGERHNVWAHEFIRVLGEEKSWKPLLEL